MGHQARLEDARVMLRSNHDGCDEILMDVAHTRIACFSKRSRQRFEGNMPSVRQWCDCKILGYLFGDVIEQAI
jgi:hypothetical protein